MATEWVVTAAAERFTLDAQNRGETTFTVTNPGPAPDRVVFEPVPGDGALRSWFAVEEPQRPVGSNTSATFLMRAVVPPGTAPGTYWVQGRAYSANTPPEESSKLSGRVALEVRPSAKPARPWWPYAVAAALVLIVLVVVGWLITRSNGTPAARPSPSPSVSPTPPPSPTPTRPPPPIRAGVGLLVRVGQAADLDAGTVGGPAPDIVFSSRPPFNQSGTVDAIGPAGLALLGQVGATNFDTCARVPVQSSLPFEILQPGTVICVRTSEGQIVVARVRSQINPFSGVLDLTYDLYPKP
jgi:hypothetical protein